MLKTVLVLQTIGPLLLVAGAGLLVNKKYYQKLRKEFDDSVFMILVVAMVTLVAGLMIINGDHSWQTHHGIVANLLGWAMFFKGLFLTIAPASMIQLTKKLLKQDHWLEIEGTLAIILGLYITTLGFFLI